MKYAPLVISSIGDSGAPGHYRIIYPLQTADAMGVIQLRMPDKPVFLDIDFVKNLKPDTIFLQRSHTDRQVKYIKALKEKSDIFTVLDIDDWYEQVPKYSPHYSSAINTISKEIRHAVDKVDRLVVTNDLLANVYGNKKDTHIIPNYMSEALWSEVYRQGRNPQPRLDTRPLIGWSGGSGHVGDVELLVKIADALGDSVRWVFLGLIPKNMNPSLFYAPPSANQKQYPSVLYNLDIDLAVAPLIDNNFNKAKSNLKLLEYGVCSYPTIASDVKPYRDAVNKQDCPITLLPWNVDEWVSCIKYKLANLYKLKEEGEKLKEWVWTNYKLEDHVDEYSQALSPDGVGFKPSAVENPEDTVDVIITTRNHPDVVKRCVDSVLASLEHNKTHINIIISDNASNDPKLLEYFDELKKEANIVEFNQQSEDIGYTNNINSAIALHPNRDVITLNSDTYVVNDWVDRLKTHTYKENRIASSTPMTNNCSIMSYPDPKGSALQPALVKFYDSVLSGAALAPIPLPSSVGFCTFIRRAAIADIGVFDDHAFGRGYGEENDWSLRALKRTWAHAGITNVYVGHQGTVTFGNEREVLQKNANDVLMAKWPQYKDILETWSKQGHLTSVHQRLDIASIQKITTEPRTMYILHNIGGGLETYVQSLLKKDNNAVLARYDYTQPGIIRLEIPGENYFSLPIFSTKVSDMNYIANTLKAFSINKISVQTTFGYDYNVPVWIMNVASMSGVPYEIMIHDFWFICPRLRLIGKDNKFSYCGMPTDEHTCNECVKKFGSVVGQVDIADWRNMNGKFLRGASNISAPSTDTISRINSFIDCKIDLVPHETNVEIGEWEHCSEKYVSGDVRVAIIGAVSTDKGSRVVTDCIRYCEENKLPVKFISFGSLSDSMTGQTFKSSNKFTALGVYEGDEGLQVQLRSNRCHVAFFPALWPETYSYTLSAAFKANLLPIAWDISSGLTDRIKDKDFGKLIPFDSCNDPKLIIEYIMNAVGAKSE